MATKLNSEIFQLATALEKAIGESEDVAFDILTSLSKVPMTTEILRQTKVGVVVNKAKKFYCVTEGNSAAALAQRLVADWKKLVSVDSAATTPAAKHSTKSSDATACKSVSKSTSNESSECALDVPTNEGTTSCVTSPSGDESPRGQQADKEIQDQLDKLDKFRKQIADVLVDLLSKNCDTGLAKFLALSIETGLNEMFQNDTKSYTAKFRTLLANLKRNEALRLDIISGQCTPEILLRLTPAEMATGEQRDARAAEVEDSKMARRLDFYAIKREEIQKSVGVNPMAGGGFVCRKCKKERTSFYQMQTRSSDEPMTVFINCLDCGFRWRE